jgi:hypothetical protein
LVPIWIRCRDDQTGHEFDATPQQSTRPGVTPIDGYPPNSGPGAKPRPAKAFVGKSGRRAAPKRKTQRPAPPATETEN